MTALPTTASEYDAIAETVAALRRRGQVWAGRGHEGRIPGGPRSEGLCGRQHDRLRLMRKSLGRSIHSKVDHGH